jgi:hypothetical protein
VLTLIVEVMALATEENIPAVQNCDATTATPTRAVEPCSLAAIVAGRPFNIYPVIFRFPRFTGTAALVCEPQRIALASHSNRGDHFGCTQPLPRERTARLQELVGDGVHLTRKNGRLCPCRCRSRFLLPVGCDSPGGLGMIAQRPAIGAVGLVANDRDVEYLGVGHPRSDANSPFFAKRHFWLVWLVLAGPAHDWSRLNRGSGAKLRSVSWRHLGVTFMNLFERWSNQPSTSLRNASGSRQVPTGRGREPA